MDLGRTPAAWDAANARIAFSLARISPQLRSSSALYGMAVSQPSPTWSALRAWHSKISKGAFVAATQAPDAFSAMTYMVTRTQYSFFCICSLLLLAYCQAGSPPSEAERVTCGSAG